MRREKDLKRYGKVLSENLSKYLKGDLKVSYDIYPSSAPGALLVVNVSKEKKRDSYQSLSRTVSEALSLLNQNFIGGNLKNVNFSGTSIFMDGNRIILIKGDDEQNTWSNKAAIDDVKKIVKPSKRG